MVKKRRKGVSPIGMVQALRLVETSTPTVASLERVWSEYQLALFAEVHDGTGHVVVEAMPGSGKTTSIVEMIRRVPEGKTVAFFAFNADIVKVAKSKISPDQAEVMTFHSFGRRNAGRRGEPQAERTDRILRWMDPEYTKVPRAIRNEVRKAVGLAKGNLATTKDEVLALMAEHEINLDSEEGRTLMGPDAFAETVLTVLDQAKRGSGFDFDDMCWLPVVLGLAVRQYDIVFVDETQDLNPCQEQLVLRAVAPGGRIIAVGDGRQAIYGFRGAGSEVMPRLAETLSAKVMPLSVTYRCAKAIVRVAQSIEPRLEAAPGAEEGIVRDCDVKEAVKGAMPGDFVLSRTNAPLVALCMKFWGERRKAFIQGRNVGDKLIQLVRKSKATNVPDLLTSVSQWCDREVQKLERQDRDASGPLDILACFEAICEDCATVQDVSDTIRDLFEDAQGDNAIVLSSTHKAKGMEKDRVWLLRDTYMRAPRKGRKVSAAKLKEEENLFYVAVTRAAKELVMVVGIG